MKKIFFWLISILFLGLVITCTPIVDEPIRDNPLDPNAVVTNGGNSGSTYQVNFYNGNLNWPTVKIMYSIDGSNWTTNNGVEMDTGTGSWMTKTVGVYTNVLECVFNNDMNSWYNYMNTPQMNFLITNSPVWIYNYDIYYSEPDTSSTNITQTDSISVGNLNDGDIIYTNNFTVTGTANASNGVYAIYYQLDVQSDTNEYNANGTDNWTISLINLFPGNHTLDIWGEDDSYNSFGDTTITFTVTNTNVPSINWVAISEITNIFNGMAHNDTVTTNLAVRAFVTHKDSLNGSSKIWVQDRTNGGAGIMLYQGNSLSWFSNNSIVAGNRIQFTITTMMQYYQTEEITGILNDSFTFVNSEEIEPIDVMATGSLNQFYEHKYVYIEGICSETNIILNESYYKVTNENGNFGYIQSTVQIPIGGYMYAEGPVRDVSGTFYVYQNNPDYIDMSPYRIGLEPGTNQSNIEFGTEVAISSDGLTVIASSPTYDIGGIDNGAIFVYTSPDISWELNNILTGGSLKSGKQFGRSLDISGDGLSFITGTKEYDYGGVVIYKNNTSSWNTYEITPYPNNLQSGDNFGFDVAISADATHAIVGSPVAHGASRGLAFVFDISDPNSIISYQLTNLDPVLGDQFGTSVAINSNGNRVVIGASYDDDGNSQGGTINVFDWNGTEYIHSFTFIGSNGGGNLGEDVSISANGNTIVSFDAVDDDVYIYEYNGTWSLQKISIASANTYTGDAIDISVDGNTILIGDYYDNYSEGRVIALTRNIGTWNQTIINNPDNEYGDSFGYSVGVDKNGNKIVIGIPNDKFDGLTDSGSVYITSDF